MGSLQSCSPLLGVSHASLSSYPQQVPSRTCSTAQPAPIYALGQTVPACLLVGAQSHVRLQQNL